ncbi:hypothetical protein COCSUDRAFT_67422 [Coccomyxa subellipsoidea C-169]|uniref:Uncharacterized protein n=1 Tax=Coccomyxa subellipsoidea (strain C-169) TaxID=574566 RepID=I0YQ93_COCSC|nr:hypothetical protein COCSUDRAFT_67422 [Coccomyxa subellipsoidea C-169]EIE20562.1 hypothetical protein COCSUDRAFT_67422 [Coccomyxa subellipsoidea C-169]|eukprot:XP_005645106.1 hypothetical protein COCSUDRAFT_67422 [Coccomyxa subellipsoidea C-169]
MARISIMVLFCLGALATIEARHLLLNTAAYSADDSLPGPNSSYQATGGSAAASNNLPPIQLPSLSQLKAFFDALPGGNIFEAALGPALAPAPATDLASAPVGAAMAPSAIAVDTTGTQT